MNAAYKLGIFLLCSVLFVNVYAKDNKEKVRQKIEEANKVFAEEMVSGNYEKCLEFYSDDAISMPMFSKMNRGKQAIEEHFKKESEMGKISNANFQTMELLGESDYFIEIGTYAITMEMKNMDEPMNDAGKYVNVWRVLPDGSVKLVADIWNTDINYMEKGMAGEVNSKDDEMTGGKK